MLSLLTNTIEGAARTTLGIVKVIPGALIAPLDDCNLLSDALTDTKEGIKQIGKTDK